MTGTSVQASNKAINAKIGLIKRNIGTLQDNIQTCMVMISDHGIKHGDVTAAARLVNALETRGGGSVMRRNLIINHIEEHTGIRFSKKDGVYKAHIGVDSNGNKLSWTSDAIRANKWFERDEARKEPEMWTAGKVDDTVVDLADKLKRKIKLHEEGKMQFANDDAVAEARATVAYLSGFKRPKTEVITVEKAKEPEAAVVG